MSLKIDIEYVPEEVEFVARLRTLVRNENEISGSGTTQVAALKDLIDNINDAANAVAMLPSRFLAHHDPTVLESEELCAKLHVPLRYAQEYTRKRNELEQLKLSEKETEADAASGD